MLTGSTGLVGTALTPVLAGQGHQVRRLRREPSAEADATHWNPADGTFARGVTNPEFTKTMGKVLRRQTVLPVPVEFAYPNLEGALRHVFEAG